MKKISLVIAIIGIFILLVILNFTSPRAISTPEQLSKLTPNSKVQTPGRVINERPLYQTTKILKLDNNIEVICDSCPPYINRTLTVIGVTESYQNRTQIKALRVTLSPRA